MNDSIIKNKLKKINLIKGGLLYLTLFFSIITIFTMMAFYIDSFFKNNAKYYSSFFIILFILSYSFLFVSISDNLFYKKLTDNRNRKLSINAVDLLTYFFAAYFIMYSIFYFYNCYKLELFMSQIYYYIVAGVIFVIETIWLVATVKKK